MGVNASRLENPVDVDAKVVLRASDAAAVTSTAIGTPVDLQELDGAYWDDGNVIPHGKFVIEGTVTARAAGGTNAYSIDVVVDDVVTMDNTPVQIATKTITAVGPFRFVIDSRDIPGRDPDTSGTSKWLALRATVAGDTSPSITFQGGIRKSLGA